MALIASTDITDHVALQIIGKTPTQLSAWYTLTDNEIYQLCDELSVDRTLLKIPITAPVKKFAVSYFCMAMFRDLVGAINTDDLVNEKYRIKYALYKAESAELRGRISSAMLYDYQNGEYNREDYLDMGIRLVRV